MFPKRATVLLFAIFFFVFTSSQAFAQMIPLESVTPSPIPSPKEIQYPLPYPGILPGRPTYVLKTIRDKVLEVFTLSPVKKTEFYLLQADKRLSSSLILFDLGEEVNGEITLSKSQNYLEKAIEEEIKARKTSGDLMELSAKINQSSKKQIQEIRILSKKTKGQVRLKITRDLERAKILQKRAEERSP